MLRTSLILLAFATFWSAGVTDIKELGDDNFETGVAEIETTLVMFYAPCVGFDVLFHGTSRIVSKLRFGVRVLTLGLWLMSMFISDDGSIFSEDESTTRIMFFFSISLERVLFQGKNIKMYHSYPFLRAGVIIASVLTTLQSLTWIAMTITSIIAYYCHIGVDVDPQSIVGSLLGVTMFRQYFYSGDCVPKGFDDKLFAILDGLEIVKPIDFHAISWTYLTLSFFWFVSGLLLVMYVNEKRLKWANFFIYFWVFNTLILAIADLIVGIFMARDYDTISKRLDQLTFESFSTETITVLIVARTVSWIMMGIAFRGFVLWIINVLLACYLTSHVFVIHKYNKNKTGFVNNGYVHNEMRHRSSHVLGYDAFAPKDFYGNGDSLTDIPRPRINKAQTLNNHQRAAALSLHLNHNPDKEFSYLQGGRTRPTSLTFTRGYKQNNIPRPDYSPEVPRALRLPDSIIDEHPQAVLRQSKNYKRY